jgi:hypothetical protein
MIIVLLGFKQALIIVILGLKQAAIVVLLGFKQAAITLIGFTQSVILFPPSLILLL